jgi:hypothetical protein
MFRRRSFLEDLFEGPLGCLGLVLGFVMFVAFLAALSRAAGRVTAENRRLEPGQVWLNLFPLFNLVWLPITIDRLAESLRRDLLDRGLDVDGSSYGRVAGLAWLVCWVVAVPFLALPPRPQPPGGLALFAGFVFWVVHWVQVGGFSNRIKSTDYVPPHDEGW